MSSTNRGSKRVENDKYYTPVKFIVPLLYKFNWDKVSSFLRPHETKTSILISTMNSLFFIYILVV